MRANVASLLNEPDIRVNELYLCFVVRQFHSIAAICTIVVPDAHLHQIRPQDFHFLDCFRMTLASEALASDDENPLSSALVNVFRKDSREAGRKVIQNFSR